MANGVTKGHCVNSGGTKSGNVRFQSPGSVPGVYGTSERAPSLARQARIASPTCRPNSTPSNSAGPSGTVASASASAASNTARSSGSRYQSDATRWAAAAAAATGDAPAGGDKSTRV